MKKFLNWQVGVSLGVALFATVLVYAIDQSRLRMHQTNAGLSYARQLAAQVDGLVLAARGRGEPNPLSWAVNQLSQGVEPRAIRITEVPLDRAMPEESTIFDSKAAAVELMKKVSSAEGRGVKVRVAIGFEGLLGARSVLISDFMAAVVFAMVFGICFLGIRQRVSLKSAEHPAQAIRIHAPGDGTLRSAVRDWMKESKTLLIQLGANVRGMVRSAHQITMAAVRSRDAVAQLRERAHGGVRRIHETRRSLKDVTKTAAQAEAAALNLVLEAQRLKDQGGRVSTLAEEIHRLAQELRKLHQKSEQAIALAETEWEPLVTDADIAFHAYDELFRETEGMDASIKGTTETLMGQARRVQDFSQEWIVQAPKAAATK